MNIHDEPEVPGLPKSPEPDVTDPRAVNILNVCEVDPIKFAMWVNYNLEGLRLPRPGPNGDVTGGMIAPFLAELSNRVQFATELYNTLAGYQANIKAEKKELGKLLGAGLEKMNTLLEAKKDVCYRTIQSLTNQYESASRLLTALGTQNSINKGW